MSYSDSQPPMHSQSSYQSSSPPLMPLQSSYQSDSIVIPVLPQFPMDNNDQFDPHSQFDQPPYKRHRVSDDNNSQFRVVPSNNMPVNKGTTNIFFKTKMCAKFKAGTCRNGENCNFAHGEQDRRQPPPNWQELIGIGARSSEEDRPVGNWDDDQRIIQRMKLCKKFYNGEVCPYGDRCNFLHEEPSKFRDDAGRYRESSAISIGTTGQTVGQGSVGINVAEVNRSVNTPVNINGKTVYWKTKLCTKMETTGHCPFGEKCHFAHGLAELHFHTGRLEVEVGSAGPILTKSQQSILINNASPTNISTVPSFVEEGQNNKVLLKWKGPKKINKIYGDWLDDLPLVTNFNNGVES